MSDTERLEAMCAEIDRLEAEAKQYGWEPAAFARFTALQTAMGRLMVAMPEDQVFRALAKNFAKAREARP